MHESWSSHESWVYQCLSCYTTWQEEYDARHTGDGHGGEAVVYEHHGHQCTSPWCDHICPNCEGLNVKAFSAPWGKPAKAKTPAQSEDLALLFRLRRLHAY